MLLIVCIRTKWDLTEKSSILQALDRNAERDLIGLLIRLGERKETKCVCFLEICKLEFA